MTVNWSSLAAFSGHVDSDHIRHNLLPWANFKECSPGVCTETLQAKCSFDVTERKKSKAFIWWRELWLFSFLNEAESKVFECKTSTKRKSCSRKTACAAKFALWWVGKLSDSTVFLTLERVYRIHHHKFSQNHASETHGSTGSIVAAGYPSIFKRSTWETLKLTTVIFEWGIWLWQTWWIVTITSAEWWILHIPKHVTSWLTQLQAHQYFSDRRLRGKPVYL